MIEKIKAFFAWIKAKLGLDTNKLDLADVVEVYDMVKDFISGGADGVIDATDAVILLNRLKQLVDDNKTTE
jgi:hypothetical protein